VITAAGYALLLQVAHPTVGAGVSEHSNFREDPWGRLLRTLDYACTMVYAGPAAAARMGARMRAMHARICGRMADGRAYTALEPEAYAWVHATLAVGILRAHELFGLPFSERESEELWREWRLLGRLLGIAPGDLPEAFVQFRRYATAMMEERLEHTRAVDEVLEALSRPAPPALGAVYRSLWPVARMPLSHVVLLSTRWMLTPALRARLAIAWGRREELEARALAAALRAATPIMPEALRQTGPGYLRVRGLD
jgi:uncharacterized protein (DUF2236 family)